MKEVILRKSGNSLILTAPSNLNKSVGEKYIVTQKDDGSIVYTPARHKNIFSSPDWKNYDYQKDLQNDPEVSESYPVGKEKLE